MASFTIQQLKTAIANIPADADGTLRLYVTGYIDFAGRKWNPVS